MLSRISSSSSMMRTEPLRLDIYGFPNQRKFELERRDLSKLALNGNVPAVLLHDSVADRESQTRSFADGFRREERVIDFLDVLAADTRARILNCDLYL